MHGINPVKYASTRNFGNGAVTYLSPYISRGVISTKEVFTFIQSLNLGWQKSEKLIQELAWRDYWQQVWIAKGDLIHQDLKNTQTEVSNHQISKAIIEANTSILSIDNAIEKLYKTGYMHNHMRMYIASICCNIAHSHWLEPAKWMYANLLYGDLASNQLSWQWVCGSFSSKKYIANQENINKYFDEKQTNTFLDISYEVLAKIEIPKVLEEGVAFELEAPLPKTKKPTLDSDKKTLIYNYYNLDPKWHKEENVQRILLLEPTVFDKHPVNQKCIDFIMDLAENIEGIEVFVGEFDEIEKQISTENIYYKEHPLNRHYKGIEEHREWMCSTTGYFPSFFSFWNKCKKEIEYLS